MADPSTAKQPLPHLAFVSWIMRGWRITAVGAAGFLVAAFVVVEHYGGLSFWPALVAEFAGTLLAVSLAFKLEARRETRALARIERDTDQTRSTEARKRLLALRRELEKNQTSIDEISEGLSKAKSAAAWTILHPQLLDGAWSASGERLGDLLANYELVSDLSIFYGRLEELRWRLRYRTQARSADLDGMTQALANEMRDEVEGLAHRVSNEEREPGVRPTGVTHLGRIAGKLSLTTTTRGTTDGRN